MAAFFVLYEAVSVLCGMFDKLIFSGFIYFNLHRKPNLQ